MNILHYPDPVLLTEAEEIEEVDDGVRALAAEMLKTMYESRGVGLAAPQVGVSKRLIVINVAAAPDQGEEICLANPVIEKTTRESVEAEEGCLSLPGVTGLVRRFKTVTLRGLGMDGSEKTIEAEGMLARAAQHEVDHLEGILIVERMSPADQAATKNRLRVMKSKAR